MWTAAGLTHRGPSSLSRRSHRARCSLEQLRRWLWLARHTMGLRPSAAAATGPNATWRELRRRMRLARLTQGLCPMATAATGPDATWRELRCRLWLVRLTQGLRPPAAGPDATWRELRRCLRLAQLTVGLRPSVAAAIGAVPASLLADHSPHSPREPAAKASVWLVLSPVAGRSSRPAPETRQQRQQKPRPAVLKRSGPQGAEEGASSPLPAALPQQMAALLRAKQQPLECQPGTLPLPS